MVASESGTSSCDQSQPKVGCVPSIIDCAVKSPSERSKLTDLQVWQRLIHSCEGQEAAHLIVMVVLITSFLLTGTQ